MKSISSDQLKGNWGEQYIAYLLSRNDCLIRTVPQGHDIGIDLYCEKVIDNQPLLHFFVQVRTGKSYYKKKSFYAEKKDIEYWKSQPVPVFIFIVDDKVKNNEDCNINIFSVLDFPEKKKSIKPFKKITKPKIELKQFLEDDLFEQDFLWGLMHGKVSPIKKPFQSILKEFIVGETDKYENKLLESICFTLWRVSEDILRKYIDFKTLEIQTEDNETIEEIIKRVDPYIKSLQIFVERKNLSNCEFLITIGILEELEKNYKKALDYYKNALSKLKEQYSSSMEGYDRKLEKYQNHIKRVKSKLQ